MPHGRLPRAALLGAGPPIVLSFPGRTALVAQGRAAPRAGSARAASGAAPEPASLASLALCRSIVGDALEVACGALADGEVPPARAGGFVCVL